MPLSTEAPAENPDYRQEIEAIFSEQTFMTLIGARLGASSPGHCEVHLPWRADLTQQHGYFHGGVAGAVADVAGGLAAQTLAPRQHHVLTVEYKLSLVAPGVGERLVATGMVARSGKRLITTEVRVITFDDGVPTLCALALQTVMIRRPLG